MSYAIDSNIKAPKPHKSQRQKKAEAEQRDLLKAYADAYRVVYGVAPVNLHAYTDPQDGRTWYRVSGPQRCNAKRVKELIRQLQDRGDKVKK